MSGPVTFAAISTSSLSVLCLTGTVTPRTGLDIFQRGTHLLVGSNGQVIAVLSSPTINLNQFNGQFLTVCGTNEGLIEGVPSLVVTQVFPAGQVNLSLGQPVMLSTGQPLNLASLVLLLLLQRPALLQQVSPNLLVSLLSSAGVSASTSVSI